MVIKGFRKVDKFEMMYKNLLFCVSLVVLFEGFFVCGKSLVLGKKFKLESMWVKKLFKKVFEGNKWIIVGVCGFGFIVN